MAAFHHSAGAVDEAGGVDAQSTRHRPPAALRRAGGSRRLTGRRRRDRHPAARPTAARVRALAPVAGPARLGRRTLRQVPTAPSLSLVWSACCACSGWSWSARRRRSSPSSSTARRGRSSSGRCMWMAIGAAALAPRLPLRLPAVAEARGCSLLVVTIGLLLVVLVPDIGVTAGGSTRWIGVRPVRHPAVGADEAGPGRLRRRSADPAGATGSPSRARWSPRCSSCSACSAVLILKQPDMGTALVLGCIALAILFMGGVPMRPIMKVLGASPRGLALVVGLVDPYRRDRILSFLNPGAHQSGSGYQVVAVADRPRLGTPLRPRPRRRPREVGLPAERPHRLHLLGRRRGARAGRGGRRSSGCSSRLAWFGFRAATRAPGPVRQPARGRRHRLDHQPGGDQRRRGHRRAAGDRHPAARSSPSADRRSSSPWPRSAS